MSENSRVVLVVVALLILELPPMNLPARTWIGHSRLIPYDRRHIATLGVLSDYRSPPSVSISVSLVHCLSSLVHVE